VLKHRAQGDSPAEPRQIAQVANDPVGIVGGRGKGEADRHRGRGALFLDAGKTLDEVRQATVKVVAVGRQRDGLGDRLQAAHGGEAEVCATGRRGS
jgi:hypothetical protein